MYSNDIHADTSSAATIDTDQEARPVPKSTWPRWAVQALTRVDSVIDRSRRLVLDDPSGAARLLGSTVAVALAVVLFISATARLLVWLVRGNPAHDLAAAVPAMRIVTNPIAAWLTAHTAGLPLTVQAAAWIWGLTGFVLFYSAIYHHTGARVLWSAYGIATAAMVWFGTNIPAHRPVAVGLLAVAWAVLSLLALHREHRPRRRQVRRPRRQRPTNRPADTARPIESDR